MNNRLRIGASTYSFWHFKGDRVPIESCIDQLADMGFDGVEILHQQMESEENGYLQNLKQRAFRLGLDLIGFSTHQTFVSPDAEVRKKNIDHTIRCIELAYQLGIPHAPGKHRAMGTSKSFDELMANRGIEPNLPGYSDDQGFEWVIDSLTECLPATEKCGVTLGLENHWGLGRSAVGVMRVVNAINSPWLKVTLDTGNFLEDMYDQMQVLAPHAVLIQAKTYFGGGEWYTLEIDYPKVASILRSANYRGYISLEMEGKAPAESGVRESLALFRSVF